MFNTNNGSGRNGNAGNSGSNTSERNDNWKAHGFLNVYVANKSGGRSKLGFIPLKTSNARELQLSEWLAGDDEQKSRLNLLLSQCQFEFNIADTGDANHFDLPFAQAAE